MPGMSFKRRPVMDNVPTQDKGHKQFNFTLQPLVGVEQNIRDMIQPEDSQPLQEISKTIVSDEAAFHTSYEERQRPKRKAPIAPGPSAKFVSSSTEFGFGSDENADYNIRSGYEPQSNKPTFKKPKIFTFEDGKTLHYQDPIATCHKNTVSPDKNMNIGTTLASSNVIRGIDTEESSTITSKSESDKVEFDGDEDITNPILNSKFANGRIHVVARCRPKIAEDEHADIDTYKRAVYANKENHQVTLKREFCQDRIFKFDSVLSEESTQKETFQTIAEDVVKSVETGINGTIMCYGQTGGGKTYTAFGMGNNKNKAGIVPRCIDHLFRYINAINGIEGRQAKIRVSLLQIYMENITDLLDGDMKKKKQNPLLAKCNNQVNSSKNHLQIREDSQGNIFVQDLTCLEATDPTQVLSMVRKAMDNRISGETRQNSASSRSHAVLQLHLEQSMPLNKEDNMENAVGRTLCCDEVEEGNCLLEGEQVVKTWYSTLSIIDLAGSERVAKSRSKGQRFQEARKINKSIAALGNCISALAEANSTSAKSKRHIPFRDSQLTRLLTDSLGGNTRTCLCVNVGPATANYEETYASMLLARRAMQVRNCAVVNEAHEVLEQSVPDEVDSQEHTDMPNESIVSEDDFENKQKTLLRAMSTPLASCKKRGAFFSDDAAMDNGEYSILEQHDNILKMKETENSKLLAENTRNSAEIKRIEFENAQLRCEVDSLKQTISQLEHNLQEQKQQLQLVNRKDHKDQFGWENREQQLVTKFTSIIHNLQMEIAKQNVAIAKLRKMGSH